ncbi:HAD-IA family hydrolase [Salipiger sp. P9]|uniref:HAD-IA family hydrolase n=1 Tax=Salipiger pentaromativorans TaxID=2943193 RepID=UPI0021586D0A|nr:HAD-IA family hydrolase [Salipiger pentaromativorans]MCR8546742.1 HAD-IA family hydrolase [Salipiger pentaromativorans]
MTLRALIFDVDGTLAETEEAHRLAFNETFSARGLGWHWTRDDYRRLLKTTGGKERIRAYLAERGASEDGLDIAALHAAKTTRYVEILESGGLALRPGVGDLVAAARNTGLRLAVATTTSRPNVEALCRCCWGRPGEAVFDVIAAGDEVAAKKPAPDVYDLALKRLGLPAALALALEDSRNGVLSAQAAGLRVIVTPSVYTEDEDFGAAEVLASLAPAELPVDLRAALAPRA